LTDGRNGLERTLLRRCAPRDVAIRGCAIEVFVRLQIADLPCTAFQSFRKLNHFNPEVEPELTDG
jgi:hypothetical protein